MQSPTQLPGDDHAGWDKLIAAVVLGDEDVAQRDAERVRDQDVDSVECTVDLSALQGLAALAGGGRDTTV